MSAQQTLMRTNDGTPVWVSGDGPVVVLVHGVLMDHRMWAAQVSALSNDYKVCVLDMLGHGEAPDPPGERTLDDFVAQLHEVVATCCADRKPVVGGFSMGGLIAQAYGARYHRSLSGLIFMNAVYDRSPEAAAVVRQRFEGNRAGGVQSAIDSAVARWFSSNDSSDQIDEILDWMRDGNFESKLKAHRVFATSDSQTVGRLKDITCPTLVMTGDGDTGSTPEMSRAMASEIMSSQLHILDDQRHMMPVLDASRVNALLLTFLARAFSRDA